MKTLAFLGIVITAWIVYSRENAPLTYPPGVLIAADPTQIAAPDDAPISFGKFQLKPLAQFSCDARVLHRKTYRYDRCAALAPVDLAIGWGPMSDQAVLDQLTISQAARFFYYEYRQPPIPQEAIISHATNVHVIPSTPEIEARCKGLRSGELIHLSGLLVEAAGNGLGTWRSSLTRTDSGNGACELVWVEQLEKLER